MKEYRPPEVWIPKETRSLRRLRVAFLAVAAFCGFTGLFALATSKPLWQPGFMVLLAAQMLFFWQRAGVSMRFFQADYDEHHGDASAGAS